MTYIYRSIMEDHIGRALQSSQCIHHIDLDHSNNELSNLQILSRIEHSRLHQAIRQDGVRETPIPAGMMRLMSLLQERQGDLSDAAFARKLGIGQALWCLVKHGNRGMGMKTLRKIAHCYPDLVDEIMKAL